jgi:hypothetical protein
MLPLLSESTSVTRDRAVELRRSINDEWERIFASTGASTGACAEASDFDPASPELFLRLRDLRKNLKSGEPEPTAAFMTHTSEEPVQPTVH